MGLDEGKNNIFDGDDRLIETCRESEWRILNNHNGLGCDNDILSTGCYNDKRKNQFGRKHWFNAIMRT